MVVQQPKTRRPKRRYWIGAVCVEAYTRSEARSLLKKAMNIKGRLPVGIKVE